MEDYFQGARNLRQSTKDQTAKTRIAQSEMMQSKEFRRMQRIMQKELANIQASPKKRLQMRAPPDFTGLSRADFQAAQSAVNATILRKVDRQLALSLMQELPRSMPGPQRDVLLRKYQYLLRTQRAKDLNDRLNTLYPQEDRMRREQYKARVAKQLRYAKVNKVRNTNIAGLNAAGFYNNRNNFRGSGLYRRKRPKRRVYSKVNRYLGKKPKRSKKRTLKSLLCSIANRRSRK